jgi:HSP20 family molecular chaperone IbpA
MTVPGLDEKDLKVDVSADNTLTIRSEKNLVQKTSSGTEHAFGSFTQILTLPSDAEAARIHTSYKDGQYTVTLPRKGDGSQSSEQPEERGRSL